MTCKSEPEVESRVGSMLDTKRLQSPVLTFLNAYSQNPWIRPNIYFAAETPSSQEDSGDPFGMSDYCQHEGGGGGLT